MTKYQYDGDAPEGLDLPKVPVVKFKYNRSSQQRHHELRKEFNRRVKREFRMYLAEECEKELLEAGFTDDEIEKLGDGKGLEGFNVHHVYPIDDSGSNDFDNLVLIDLDSHARLHQYLDPQLYDLERGRTVQVDIPVPGGHVYVHPDIVRARLKRQDDEAVAEPDEAEDDYSVGLSR